MVVADPALTASGVREVQPADVPVVLRLIRDLAAYEREPDAVRADEGSLQRALFEDGSCSAHVAVHAGQVVGFALWYPTFSTWTGRPGLWLEDLFVAEHARGAGLGRALVEALAQVCLERGWPRLEWWVLDWNIPAQEFYLGVGARPQDEWTVWRVDGAALERLGAPPAPGARREQP